MPNDFLIRDLSEDASNWIENARPAGLSKQEFLHQIIASAMQEPFQLPMFTQVTKPQLVYGELPFKFVDLFAGIGGFHCAMKSVGGSCVFTSEWDKYAAKTYQAWYGADGIFTGDIRDLPPPEIPDHDVLCAGFPCQPFSLAGVSKKNSLGRKHGFEDEHQGNLFFSILNIIDEKRPPVLFLENVPNLKSHDKGRTWQVIEDSLLDRDYVVYSNLVDASQWVPQKRRRVFIVCFDRNIFGREDQIRFEWPENRPELGPALETILESSPDKKYMLSDKLWKYLFDYAAKHREKGNGFGYGLNTGSDVARTMSARYHKDGSEILIKQKSWKNPRRLTPREAQLLMGYDSRYARMFGHEEAFPQVVSDTQAYRQFGNSVVPQAVESVAKQMVKVISQGITRTGNGCLLKLNG
jgi:DNA (cytosine-5)-methyltransferase 1